MQQVSSLDRYFGSSLTSSSTPHSSSVTLAGQDDIIKLQPYQITSDQLSDWQLKHHMKFEALRGLVSASSSLPSSSTSPLTPTSSVEGGYALFIDDLEAFEALFHTDALARTFLSHSLSRLAAPPETDFSWQHLHLQAPSEVPVVRQLACFGRSSPTQPSSSSPPWSSSQFSTSAAPGAPLKVPLTSYCLNRYEPLSRKHLLPEDLIFCDNLWFSPVVLSPLLTTSVRHACRATVIVEVCPLASGFSSEVHGMLRVTSRHSPQICPPGLGPTSTESGSSSRRDDRAVAGVTAGDSKAGSKLYQRVLTYKALETGIRCAVIGSMRELS